MSATFRDEMIRSLTTLASMQDLLLKLSQYTTRAEMMIATTAADEFASDIHMRVHQLRHNTTILAKVLQEWRDMEGTD